MSHILEYVYAYWQAYKSSRRLVKARKNAVLEGKLGYWCEGTYYSLHASCKHKEELEQLMWPTVDHFEEYKKMIDEIRDETNRVEITPPGREYKVSDKSNELDVIPMGFGAAKTTDWGKDSNEKKYCVMRSKGTPVAVFTLDQLKSLIRDRSSGDYDNEQLMHLLKLFENELDKKEG